MKLTRNMRFTDAAKDSAGFTDMVRLLQQVAGLTADSQEDSSGNVAINGSAERLAIADWL